MIVFKDTDGKQYPVPVAHVLGMLIQELAPEIRRPLIERIIRQAKAGKVSAPLIEQSSIIVSGSPNGLTG
jgi:hypothetical protein